MPLFRPPRRPFFPAAAFLAVTLGALAGALAHDPGLSALTLRTAGGRLEAELNVHAKDLFPLLPLDADGDGRLAEAELAAALPALERLARSAVEVTTAGRVLPVVFAAAGRGEGEDLRLRVVFAGSSPTSARVRSVILQRLGEAHRQFLEVIGPDGRLRGNLVLRAGRDAAELDLPPGGGAGGAFFQFFLLGIEHIGTGYDHLAFLLALFLTGGSFRNSAWVITAFTLAHSLTLALATFDAVRVSPAVVEPLIAATIIYVGAENLFRRDFRRRWILTFSFGLIHGLGFASVLRDLGVGSSGAGAGTPLLGFNLGVEAGQIAVAGVVLPLVWRLERTASFKTRMVPAASAAIALLGVGWLAQRLG